MSSHRIHTPVVASLLALSICAAHASAAPVERTHPANLCSISNSNDFDAEWFSSPDGFAFGVDNGLRSRSPTTLVVQCPVIKQNVGDALSRAFAWVSTSNTNRSLLCSLQSRRMSTVGLAGTFFSNAFQGPAFDPSDPDVRVRSRRRLEFSAAAVPDVSLPVGAAVEEPTVYNLQCQLPFRSKVLGYHVAVDG